MATPRPTRKYNCTQAELYAICTIGWQSYLENQPDFEAFSTLYTVPFGDAALLEIDAAKNLSDFQARNQATETAYILMGQEAEAGLTKWRTLRSYIKASFPAELQKPNIESAGEDHYNKAMTRNWGETELMFTSALAFIAANTPELTTGGMPATFQADFETIKINFDKQYTKFTDAEQDEHQGTDLKIEANNAIYEKLQRMFEDGQIIFEKDASKRERFIFSRIKTLITSSPTSGSSPVQSNEVQIAGNVSSSETGQAIEGATITVTPTAGGQAVNVQSQPSGAYKLLLTDLTQSEPFNIDVEVSAIDFQTQNITIEVSPGQAFIQDVALTPSVTS